MQTTVLFLAALLKAIPPIATHYRSWSVRLYVVYHTHAPCWMKWDAICQGHSCIRQGPQEGAICGFRTPVHSHATY